MDKKRYVKRVLKYLKAPGKVKERIRMDLLTSIESREEEGLSMDKIMGEIGSPREVAENFNRNYPEYALERRKRVVYFLILFCGAAALVCLIGGAIGRALWKDSVAFIGGADRPTEIQVVSQPVSPLEIYGWLTGAALALLLAAVLLTVYFLIKYKWKKR